MTARRTAANLTPGDSVPWRSLEHSAFEDFPEVVSQLRQPMTAGKPPRRFIYFLPLVLLFVVIYGAPIWGLVTVVGPWGLSQTTRTAQGDITVAGVLFGVALVSLLVHSALWFFSGRPAKTALAGNALMGLLLGGLSAGVTVMRGIENSVPDWALWILPMLACVVVGGTMLLLVRGVRRRSPTPVEPQVSQPSAIAAEDLLAIRETIDRVPEENQLTIRTDLTTAIDDLEQRAVITAQDAEHARSAKLGELAVQMTHRST